jgi:hypothetical protein
LVLTALVLEEARRIRKHEAENLNSPPPPLTLYLEQAVKELAAWHPLVMEEIRSYPNQKDSE